ncbi:MAG: Fe-Mn family superoxide dismutase [Patescibacteria group bacterium]
MHTYSPRQFSLPELKGISGKQLEVHLKLYQGYVTHTNLLREKLTEMSEDKEKNAYAIAELRRRFAFEFDGMRMHEYYFEQWEVGPKTADSDSSLSKVVSEKYGSWDRFISHFEEVALSRGIGWTILYYDPVGKTPHISWVTDHELGHLAGLPVILALDMWEHAFMADYMPADKKKYIAAFFENINWDVPEKRLEEAQKIG